MLQPTMYFSGIPSPKSPMLLHHSNPYHDPFPPAPYDIGRPDDAPWLWEEADISSLLRSSSDDASRPLTSPSHALQATIAPPSSSAPSTFDDDARTQPSSLDSSPSLPSPPSSSASASSVSSAASVQSDSPIPKRQKVGVSVVVAEQVKRTHREIDWDRRQKEAALVRRLDELTDDSAPVDEQPVVAGGKRKKPAPRKREKVAVLQACVDKLDRLQALIDRLMEAPNAKDARVHALAQHLQEVAEFHDRSTLSTKLLSSTALGLLPSTTSAALRYLDSQHSLYSSMFVRGTMTLTLLDCASGNLLDANALFFHETGWRREELIGRCLLTPFRVLLGDGWEQMTEEEIKRRPLVPLRSHSQQKAAVEEGDLPMVPLPTVRQYPSSVALAKEMAAGRRNSLQAVWRGIWADGRLHEGESVMWVAKTQTVYERDGSSWEMPVRIIKCAISGAYTVDLTPAGASDISVL